MYGFLGGLRLHLLVQRLQVHALGLPELDLRHRAGVLVLLRGQQVGRVLAKDLRRGMGSALIRSVDYKLKI